jgi:erythromycin esterase
MKRAALAFLLLLAAAPQHARMRAVRSGPIDTPSAWLRHRAVLPSSVPRIAGDAQVVALGDVTHATREVYLAKQTLVAHLVDAGFRTIAFEAPYSEYKALDAYVVHGVGDPAAALNLPFYWFWDTEEILDLVRWARAQNAAGLTPPIRVAGIDPTTPRSAAAEVIAYLRRVDPPAASAAEEAYHCLRDGYTGADRCRISVASVRTAMLARTDSYVLASSHEELEEMLHAARVVEQGERVLAEGYDVRDEPMAENVLRLASRHGRVIVLGHNEHWGRTPYQLDSPTLLRSAGSHLAASLGDRYFALGSIALDGTFLAVEYTPGVRSGVIQTQIMTAPSPDDVATILAQARLDSMILPLRGALPEWLTGTRRMRFAGSTVTSRERATHDVPIDLAAKFDAVLYVSTSTPTRLRHWPRF